jgi:Bacterial inner membrane protein
MIIDLTNPASIFGFAGVLANFCWPMMRKRAYLLAGQVVACCFMFAHFALLGAYTGAVIMGVAGFQAALAIPLGKNPKFKFIYLASLLLTPIVCYSTWQGVQSIFSSLALAIVCVANFQLNEIRQRALLISAIFAWFAHNLIVDSVPGIISNTLALAISSRMLFIAAQNKRE